MSDLKPGTRVKVAFEGVVVDLSDDTAGLGLDELLGGFSLIRQDDAPYPYGTVHAVWTDDATDNSAFEVIPPALPDVHPADVWASHENGNYLVHLSPISLTPLFYPVTVGGPNYMVHDFFAKFPNAELRYSSWNA